MLNADNVMLTAAEATGHPVSARRRTFVAQSEAHLPAALEIRTFIVRRMIRSPDPEGLPLEGAGVRLLKSDPAHLVLLDYCFVETARLP